MKTQDIPPSKEMLKSNGSNEKINGNMNIDSATFVDHNPSNSSVISGNSTTHGENEKAYELNESNSVKKESSLDFRVFISLLAIIFILLAIGYKKHKKEE
jgi:hypothetical protein